MIKIIRFGLGQLKYYLNSQFSQNTPKMSNILRINEILKEKKVLQKDLAEMLGVSKVTVSYWCNNQTAPSLDTLRKIADLLKVKISDLIKE